jgi:hypothetical protein
MRGRKTRGRKMSGRGLVGIVAVLVSLFAVRAMAHHSFAAEFDETKPIKLTGTVTGMLWSNPHAWIYLDVKGADGKIVNWAFETGGVNALYRQGWRKEDLPVGTVLVIDGWRARNGTPTANVLSVRFQDGRRLFAGTSAPKSATEGK